MEAGIQQLLVSNAAVAALVATRIYPVVLPESGTFPAATYQRISTTAVICLGGPSSLTRARLQIDAWGESYSDAKALGDAIRAALEKFRGALPDSTVVSSLYVDTQRDSFESATRLYRVSTDYLIWYFRP